MDLDRFEERAAIMEFDGGLSRFQAETLAAQAQGFERWEVKNEIGKRNTQQARNQRSENARDAANDMP
jgi:hypothetical protein